MTTDLASIGQRLADLERIVKNQQRSSRLGSASLDDTALAVRGPSGSLRGLVGQQADGTTAVNIVNGGPPPAPSTPVAAPALGGIAVGWDGTFAGGAVPPLDWSRIEVHASATSGFTPSSTTLQATVETPQGGTVYIPATVPQYVVLLARNTSGAASAPSAQVGPYSPRTIVDTDVADGSITTTKIADDAVTTPKVLAGAIQTAQLAALAITAGKLAVGSVDATALNATAITGKTITGGTITGSLIQTAASGARAVLDDSDGSIQVFDASSNVTNYFGGPRAIIWNQLTPGDEFVGMFAGNFIMGMGDPTSPTDTDLGVVSLLGMMGSGLGSVWQSPKAGSYTSHAFVNLLSGTSAAVSGSVNFPQLQVSGDVSVSGALVKTSTSYDATSDRYKPETWHTVGGTGNAAFNTGFSTATAIGSLTALPPLHYRLDTEDNVILEGLFTAAASGFGTAVVQIPYHPAANSAPIPVVCRSGSTVTTVWLDLSSAGNLNFNNGGLGSTVTASATYAVPYTKIPLRNLA